METTIDRQVILQKRITAEDKSENRKFVTHTIAPVWNSESRILILGTMPSPASRAAGFFYMHAQNRFWPVLAQIFGEEFLHRNNDTDKKAAIEERIAFLERRHIALWDVLSECEITGASDSSINKELPNDFSEILAASKIAHIFCTGKTAFNLYKKHCSQKYSTPLSYLPSTSPANQAAWPTEKLTEEYKREILKFI